MISSGVRESHENEELIKRCRIILDRIWVIVS